MSSTAGNPFGTLYGGPLHQQPTSSGNQAANSAIPPPLGKLRLKLIKLEYIPNSQNINIQFCCEYRRYQFYLLFQEWDPCKILEIEEVTQLNNLPHN